MNHWTQFKPQHFRAVIEHYHSPAQSHKNQQRAWKYLMNSLKDTCYGVISQVPPMSSVRGSLALRILFWIYQNRTSVISWQAQIVDFQHFKYGSIQSIRTASVRRNYSLFVCAGTFWQSGRYADHRTRDSSFSLETHNQARVSGVCPSCSQHFVKFSDKTSDAEIHSWSTYVCWKRILGIQTDR